MSRGHTHRKSAVPNGCTAPNVNAVHWSPQPSNVALQRMEAAIYQSGSQFVVHTQLNEALSRVGRGNGHQVMVSRGGGGSQGYFKAKCGTVH